VISILCPTRNRPEQLTRMAQSVADTVSGLGQVEILFYVDNDDQISVPAIEALEFGEKVGINYKVGPRVVLTQAWNELLPIAKGDLFMQGNDDVIFRSPSWNVAFQGMFDASPDKIWFAHGSDEGMHFQNFGAHGVVHKKWVDAIGYFIPPYFESDFGDKWLNDVANAIKRRIYLPVIIEHMHFMFNKAKKDSTTLERLARHRVQNSDEVWNRTDVNRKNDINTLRKIINPSYRPDPVLSCGFCGSTAVVDFSGIRRCNQCGRQTRPR